MLNDVLVVITWILAMAATYSPEEVAFLLIDYKGGGLATAFENPDRRLPHLAGTITNLDGAGIARSLVSITAELKRRQALMNEARAAAGGDNVDIYSYIRMRRAGVTLPDGTPLPACPHLFIVADEFAELKDQSPEFLDALVSAARIGRSLGVHLILATQKPDGVVSQQIWSNAKFKVCLKVADAADSKAMIQRPDAANLTDAGRFYMLVGYNEGFYAGQAAYAGAAYTPADAPWAPPREARVAEVNGLGQVQAQATPATHAKAVAAAAANGAQQKRVSQLVAMVDAIEATAEKAALASDALWLPELPVRVTVGEVREAFAEVLAAEDAVAPGKLAPVVGLVDDPANRAQYPLTLPLTDGGNAVIYGAPELGADSAINAMLWDLITTKSPEDVNLYLMDFTSESFSAFAGAPHTGGVALLGDDEAVLRTFDLLEAAIEKRRKLFASYGGSFAEYAKADGQYEPAMVLVVKGMAFFNELYESYQPRLIRIVREGARLGIYVILQAGTMQEVPLRLRAHFGQMIIFQLANANEYLNILGSIRGVAVPGRFGEGLVKNDAGVFAVQGASVCADEGATYSCVVDTCARLRAMYGLVGARAIARMPEAVTASYLSRVANEHMLPVGIYEDTLEPLDLIMNEEPIVRLHYNKRKDAEAFLCAVLPWFQAHTPTAFLDGAALFRNLPGLCQAEASGYVAVTALLDSAVSSLANASELQAIVMTGFGQLLKMMERAKAEEYRQLLQNLEWSNNLLVVLVDTPVDAAYTTEPWFKTKIGLKNGLWLGSGLDAQSIVQFTYVSSDKIDPSVAAPRGYEVCEGRYRKVRFICDVDNRSF